MVTIVQVKDDYSENVHYTIPDYPIYIRRGLLSYFPGFAAPIHWHEDIEFIAVLSGEMKYHVNEEIVTMTSGGGILVNARQMHFGFSDSRTECDFICFLLHPTLLHATSSYDRDFVLPFISSAGPPYVLLEKNVPWQKEIYHQLLYMYRIQKPKTAPLRVQSSFLTIWSLLWENMEIEAEIKDDPGNSNLAIVKNMVGFIQENYRRKISLDEIAAAGAVGQSKCCKLFSAYLGQTPNAYLNRYRLDKSAELLRYSDMSVLEIALFVGFNGSSYYAETFRKWIGVSPTEYRKQKKIRPDSKG